MATGGVRIITAIARADPKEAAALRAIGRASSGDGDVGHEQAAAEGHKDQHDPRHPPEHRAGGATRRSRLGVLDTAFVEGRRERAHRSALYGLQRALRCMHLGGAGVGATCQGWDVGDRRQRRRAVEGRRSAAAAQALGGRIDRAGHVSNRPEGGVACPSKRRGLPRQAVVDLGVVDVVALGFARSESPNTEPQRSDYAIFGIARSE